MCKSNIRLLRKASRNVQTMNEKTSLINLIGKLTGCISNLMHVDPVAFLNDCKSMFRRRINNMLRHYNFLKVWTTFCGEFSKISSTQEGEIKEFKYLNTKNYVITLDDNVDAWFETNIRGILLKELEEFQVKFISFKFYLIVLTFNLFSY